MLLELISMLSILSFEFLQVSSHSAPSCIKKTSDTTCGGFARYYHFNHIATPLPSSTNDMTFYSSRDREYLKQTGVAGKCPTMNVPEYTQEFPMALASPGEILTIQHPPRGHASQPSSPVWIYVNNVPNKYPSIKDPPESEFTLISEFPYNNCIGLDREISWANCTGTFSIPNTFSPGIYSFWWRWDLNGIPYSDCFEVNVTRTSGSGSGNQGYKLLCEVTD